MPGALKLRGILQKELFHVEHFGESMGKIIALTNQKGGVGKTTTAVNLAAGLGAAGKQVLLVDIDPQGNTTSGYGINKRSVKNSTYQLITGLKGLEACVVRTMYPGVSVVPSSIDLAGAELELVSLERREFRLRDVLLQAKSAYDFVLLDCPPSLGLLTLNGLNAADSVLIPIQCEYYALEGLSQLMSSVRSVKRLYNPSITIEGVLVTMYDSRLSLTTQVVEEVKRFFPQKVFRTTIPRNVRLAEAPGFGKPIRYYDPSSKGAQAYDSLSQEVIQNNKKEEI